MRSSSSRVMRGLAWGLLGSVAGSFCARVEWGGVARADAPRVARVTLADGQLDAATLPALSPGGRVAVPDIVPDGGRGYPNLKVELLDGGKGAPEVVAILSVEEVDSIGGGEINDKLKAVMQPRIDKLNAILARQHFTAMKAVKLPDSKQEKFHVKASGFDFIEHDGRLDVKRGADVLTAGELPSAPTAKAQKECAGVNHPYVGGLWLEGAESATPMVVVQVAYHGNDSCWEPPPVWRALRLGAAGAASATTATTPGGDRDAAVRANEEGMKRYHAKDWSGASEQFRAAIGADASYVKAHYNLACVASLTRDRGTAIAELKWLRGSGDPEAAEKLIKGKSDPDLAFVARDPEGKALLSR